MLTSYNPYTQIVQGEYPEHTSQEVQSFLATSVEVFPQWSQMTFPQRGKYLLTLAELLKSRREDLASISTEEMGMLYTDALADIDKTITNIQYFTQEAE